MNYYTLFISLSILGYTFFGISILMSIIHQILNAFTNKYEDLIHKYIVLEVFLFALFYAIFQYLNWSQL